MFNESENVTGNCYYVPNLRSCILGVHSEIEYSRA